MLRKCLPTLAAYTPSSHEVHRSRNVSPHASTPQKARRLKFVKTPDGEVMCDTKMKQKRERPRITQEDFDRVFNGFLDSCKIQTERLTPAHRTRLLDQIAASDSADKYRNMKEYFWEHMQVLCPDAMRFNQDKTAALIFVGALAQTQYEILKLCFPRIGLTSWSEASTAANDYGMSPQTYVNVCVVVVHVLVI